VRVRRRSARAVPDPDLVLSFASYPTFAGVLPWHIQYTELMYAGASSPWAAG
jgi:undecaprenyl pyrophosphate synthase